MAKQANTPPVLIARGLVKGYGPKIVLDGVDVSINSGERVGLVGPNGGGKTTLARLLCGEEPPDDGELSMRRDATVAYLSQVPRLDPEVSAMDVVLGGLARWRDALAHHVQVSSKLEAAHGADQQALLQEQAEAAEAVERLGGWDLRHRAESVLGMLGVHDPEAPVGARSGGEQRRVALARVLLGVPDLAVLDEPTNHLDVDTVEWLEGYLSHDYPGAVLLITHDRMVLDRVVNRTLELDQGRLHSYPGGYASFLEAKAARLELEARTEANRQNFLKRELEWLRRAPKARMGKQKARMERAHSALAAGPPPTRREVTSLDMHAPRQGKAILAIRGLGLELGGRALVRDLNLTLTRGQRVGIIGPNGCGKTTLLRCLMGQVRPVAGVLEQGKNTRLAYLDQARTELDPAGTVLDNVSGGKPSVKVGDRWVDVHPYLDRFLFRGQDLRQKVGSLSGGEQTRVALARLLLQPANLVLLDEPTNDLDVPTLSALEELLVQFQGTAIVVTHDRWFLDKVATDILAFEDDGAVRHYAGNYTTHRALRAEAEEVRLAALASEPASRGAERQSHKPRHRRALTYAQRLELEGLEAKVEEAEAQVSLLEERLADPAIYAHAGGSEVPGLMEELKQRRSEAQALMARWEELEEKREQDA